MEKFVRISIWGLQTILLFFLVYHQYQLKGVEEQSNNNDDNDGRISKIEAHNERQDSDIYDLIKKVNKLEKLGGGTAQKKLKSVRREKRPARLLPDSILRGKEKNYTETRFFGPATSCEEMGKLGYTLNGLYLVNGKRELSKNEIGVVFCRFKLPHGTEAAKEERIGFVNFKAKSSQETWATKDPKNQLRSLVGQQISTLPTLKPKSFQSVAVTTRVPFYCNTESNNQFFHFKNGDRNNCMGIKEHTDNRLIRSKCSNSSSIQWIKDPVPQLKTLDGAIRVCHIGYDMICLTVKIDHFTNENHIIFTPYRKNLWVQQWLVINETGQFVNLQTRLCLTSYSSNKHIPNNSKNILYGMEACSNKTKEIIAQQKWSLVPLPKCDNKRP